MIILLVAIILFAVYAAWRMTKYPTERGLRFLTLFVAHPALIQPKIIKIANKAMRALSKKHINLEVNNIKCAYYKRGKNRPLLLYIHGGGFFFTSPPMAYSEAKRYSELLDLNVVFPDYTTSMDAPYPKPFEDVQDVLLYFFKHKEEFDGRLLIAGDSAGGTLAIELASYALKHNIKIERLLLIYPVLEASSSTPSMKKFTKSPLWNSRLNERMWELYLKNGKGEYAIPTEIDNLKDFPKTFIEIEEYDALHDEGKMLYNRLKELNVDATLLDNKRTFHGYDYFLETKTVKESKQKRREFLEII